MGIEPMTSPLPRECSTTEPRERAQKSIEKKLIDYSDLVKILFFDFIYKWSGLQDSNLRHPPWKGGALPTELRPHKKMLKMVEREGFEPSKV